MHARPSGEVSPDKHALLCKKNDLLSSAFQTPLRLAPTPPPREKQGTFNISTPFSVHTASSLLRKSAVLYQLCHFDSKRLEEKWHTWYSTARFSTKRTPGVRLPVAASVSPRCFQTCRTSTTWPGSTRSTLCRSTTRTPPSSRCSPCRRPSLVWPPPTSSSSRRAPSAQSTPSGRPTSTGTSCPSSWA